MTNFISAVVSLAGSPLFWIAVGFLVLCCIPCMDSEADEL